MNKNFMTMLNTIPCEKIEAVSLGKPHRSESLLVALKEGPNILIIEESNAVMVFREKFSIAIFENMLDSEMEIVNNFTLGEVIDFIANI